jgi:pyruvate formate lyase activating enzyme
MSVGRAEWTERRADGRLRCVLCPRYCTLKEGQRGFCFVRRAEGDRVVSTAYGRASGFCVDPIEKKPLAHFLPGTSVLSFGTAGCNLGCKFCQNHSISTATRMDALAEAAAPEAIADAAAKAGCRSIAFTYNDPVIFAEYAIDCAEAAVAKGLHPVAVTAGYITERAREAFFAPLRAANVDLKAFSEDFYRRLTLSHLGPVLETLEWLAQRDGFHLEVTTLLIPGHNDSDAEIEELAGWIFEVLGPEVPLHFSAFHPDHKMRDVPRTPAATLSRARQRALSVGLHHVYTGNVHDLEGQATHCAGCGARLIARDRYTLLDYRVVDGGCPECARPLHGLFEDRPGTWGSRRRRLEIA